MLTTSKPFRQVSYHRGTLRLDEQYSFIVKKIILNDPTEVEVSTSRPNYEIEEITQLVDGTSEGEILLSDKVRQIEEAMIELQTQPQSSAENTSKLLEMMSSKVKLTSRIDIVTNTVLNELKNKPI